MAINNAIKITAPMIRPTVLIGLLLSSTSAGRRQYQTGCVSRGQQVSEKNACRKLGCRELRLSEAWFPRRTLLGSSVNRGNRAAPLLSVGRGSSTSRCYPLDVFVLCSHCRSRKQQPSRVGAKNCREGNFCRLRTFPLGRAGSDLGWRAMGAVERWP